MDESFKFKKRSQRPKLRITLSTAGSIQQLTVSTIKTHKCTHTQHTHCQHCMQTHNPTHAHQRMCTDEYTNPATLTINAHAHVHDQSLHTYAMMSTPSPLPLNSEGMTFETKRNAGCEDCFNCIYCQKAKPRWKPAKMRAVARQGCFASSLEADLNVCVCFVFLFCVFSSTNIAVLPSLCLAFLGVYIYFAKGQLCKKKLKMPGMKQNLHLSSFHLCLLWLHVWDSLETGVREVSQLVK